MLVDDVIQLGVRYSFIIKLFFIFLTDLLMRFILATQQQYAYQRISRTK